MSSASGEHRGHAKARQGGIVVQVWAVMHAEFANLQLLRRSSYKAEVEDSMRDSARTTWRCYRPATGDCLLALFPNDNE